jgi:carboxy-cis,cis-muconate cyclase
MSVYISAPAPYPYLYSVGGPTGEVHAINASSGGFGEQVQQLLFVPENELKQPDQTGGAVSIFPLLF